VSFTEVFDEAPAATGDLAQRRDWQTPTLQSDPAN
jgi:hypothetical protein